MNRDLQRYAAEILEKEEILEQLMATKHAHRVCSNNIRDYFELKYKKWCWAERKCLAKAKEFE